MGFYVSTNKSFKSVLFYNESLNIGRFSSYARWYTYIILIAVYIAYLLVGALLFQYFEEEYEVSDSNAYHSTPEFTVGRQDPLQPDLTRTHLQFASCNQSKSREWIIIDFRDKSLPHFLFYNCQNNSLIF